MFKKIMNLVLILTFVLGPQSYAGKYYDDAVKAVSTEFLNLESTVQHMILYDVQDLVARIMQSSSAHKQYIERIPQIEKRLLDLTSGFVNVASLSNQEIQDLQKYIQEEIKRYSDYNRQIYEITWIPPTAAVLQSNFKEQFQQLIRSFRMMCETGRSKFGYVGPALAIPPDPISFMVMVTAGNDGSTGVEYDQSNYGNKHLSTAANILGSVASLGATNALATVVTNQFASKSMTHVLFSEIGGLSSTQAGSVASASMAAGVAVAVIIVAIHVTGLRKYNKRMRDFIAGEVYKIHNAPTSQDINALYKENCKDLLVILDEALPLISNAIAGSNTERKNARSTILEKAKSSPEFQNDLSEYMNVFSRRSLLESYQNNLCIKQEKEYRKRDENLCQLVGTTLHAPKGVYQIENPNMVEIDELKKKEDELFDSIATGNLNHIIYKTVQDYIFNSENSLKSFNTNTFRSVLTARQNALLRLNRLLTLSSKLQDESLKNELTAFKLFMETRKKLLDTVAAAIECTFNKIDKTILLSMIEQLTPQMNLLMDRYGHLSEVRSLQFSFNQLKSYVDTL